MPRLVELYCMGGYEGLHAFATALAIIWAKRGFFGLDMDLNPEDRIKYKDFIALTNIDQINAHLSRGKMIEIGDTISTSDQNNTEQKVSK